MWAYVIFKYFATASMVVAVAEVAKRNDRLGGLLAALPLVTVMTLIWLEVENQSKELISNHAWYTLWYVIPTLPMFLGFPVLYEKLMFWRALGVSMLMTIAMAVVVALILLPFGIHIIF